MKNIFAHPELLSSDLYISDYTNYKGEAPAHGVDIETSTLEIHNVWPPLHIHNPQKMENNASNVSAFVFPNVQRKVINHGLL